MSHYPETAGWKEPDTSREAAVKSEASFAKTLRARVLLYFLDGATGSADQIADQMNVSVLAMRPRISELHTMGLIEPDGRRVKNGSGMSAKVWRRANPPDEMRSS